MRRQVNHSTQTNSGASAYIHSPTRVSKSVSKTSRQTLIAGTIVNRSNGKTPGKTALRALN
jgi:hypothetical protein